MSPLSSESHALSGEHDPHQWSKWRRWMIVFVIWNAIAPVDLALTFYSGIEHQIRKDFKTTESIVTLGVGLYNFGAVFGPLVAGPVSELCGRQPVYVTSMVGFTLLSLCAAMSPSISTLLGSRALAGLIGSGVFSIYGGSLSDMFNPHERAPLVALFTVMLQGAPSFGPMPASLLGEFVHWRWLLGFIALWAGVIAVFLMLLPETEPGAIQRKFTKQLGVLPTPPRDMSNIWKEGLFTPIIMLIHEPIVLWTTLCHAFVHGLSFLLLEGYPYVYASLFGMSRQEIGLAFLAPWSGNVLGVVVYFLFLKPQHRARRNEVFVQSAGKREISPEERLPGVLLASLFAPIGMFWFVLAARPNGPPLLAILSCIPVSMGLTLMQLSLVNYYIDLYPTRSASAVAANCAMRHAVGAISPNLAVPLYNTLGIWNTNMLLACVSCLGIPMGLVLLAYGKHLRARSRWAKQDADSAPGSGDQVAYGALAHLLGPHAMQQQDYGGTATLRTHSRRP